MKNIKLVGLSVVVIIGNIIGGVSSTVSRVLNCIGEVGYSFAYVADEQIHVVDPSKGVEDL